MSERRTLKERSRVVAISRIAIACIGAIGLVVAVVALLMAGHAMGGFTFELFVAAPGGTRKCLEQQLRSLYGDTLIEEGGVYYVPLGRVRPALPSGRPGHLSVAGVFDAAARLEFSDQWPRGSDVTYDYRTSVHDCIERVVAAYLETCVPHDQWRTGCTPMVDGDFCPTLSY